jgi:hypothetical protein
MLSLILDLEYKWVREKLEGIDFAMGIDQEGTSFDLYMK